MFDEKFWLAISSTTFLILIIKYAGPLIIRSLDTKSKQIAEEILAAKEMRENAKKLLQKAERYHHESSQYAEKLLKDAEIESQKLIESARKAVELEVATKTKAALDRIKTEEEAAIREVKTHIINSALENLSNVLAQGIAEKDSDQVIDRALQGFESKI